MHYLFYFVDFWVYFAFCLKCWKVGNSYHVCFQGEKLLNRVKLFPQEREDIEISDVKAMTVISFRR